MMPLFHKMSRDCSKIMAAQYSTSFNHAIQLLRPSIRPHIFSIYGFVRLADEIVDSFHQINKQDLLQQCKLQTFQAIDTGLSLNPILNSFQLTVNEFKIDTGLITCFFDSMQTDLHQHSYDKEGYHKYIYGSAEVVGLMCLTVFCEGNNDLFDQLKPGACALGAAFQKVNFLRDLQADKEGLGRNYFPQWQDGQPFDDEIKKNILAEIKEDFKSARVGICMLPSCCKSGVYAAYVYYKALLLKIGQTPSNKLMNSRIRINNALKLLLLFYAGLKVKLNQVQ